MFIHPKNIRDFNECIGIILLFLKILHGRKKQLKL